MACILFKHRWTLGLVCNRSVSSSAGHPLSAILTVHCFLGLFVTALAGFLGIR